jgi:phosphate transport system permease protein
MDPRPSFTGRRRHHTTRWTVLWSERLAQFCITVGGAGTILAVSAICVFLFWVVIPLFWPGSVSSSRIIDPPWKDKVPLLALVDEYQLLGCALLKDGSISVYRIDNGDQIQNMTPASLYKGAALTACSPVSSREEVALGFADGTVQLGKIGFATTFLDKTPAILRDLAVGETAPLDSGLVYRTVEYQLRLHKLSVELDPPSKATSPAPVLLIDLSQPPTGEVVSVLTSDGKLRTSNIEPKPVFAAEDAPREMTGGEITLPGWNPKDPPRWLQLTGVGDNVYLLWDDGRLLRIGVRSIEKPVVAEKMDLLQQPTPAISPPLKITSVHFQLGKSALLVGDSSGRVQAWYPFRRPEAHTEDGTTLGVAHTFAGSGSPAACLATSSRTRTMAVGYGDGQIHLYYVTSEKLLGQVQTRSGQSVSEIILTPRDDGMIAQGGGELWVWKIVPGHPEITLKALFRPVWYEGYPGPAHVWQSSGSNETEAKFGLWPLIFGTLKGAFYALLLGVPLALLAAVYTSEFLHRRTRAVVKPTIEVMAGLPSVVLGFLAAQVLAPFVEDLLPAVLTCFITLPLAFLLGAYVWQLLPQKLSLAMERWRVLFIFLVLPLGLAGAAFLGPLVQTLLFGGRIDAWLRGQIESPFPGWLLVLLPISTLLTFLLMGQLVNPAFRRLTMGWSRFGTGLADLVRFLGGCLFTLGIAAGLAAVFSFFGLDIRGSIVGKYEQRNALVVSFMMGFAIIPIIYTIAEDALSLVPEHLRSASLGCGATPWQTATRIIVPTAMSGLFSAVMVGLGRAVGETMIVLMATGGTAILDVNIFNGFRTLAANIAEEMPETAQHSTHYRVLFLCALILFLITFVLNTIAELVRLRFRKKAFQL